MSTLIQLTSQHIQNLGHQRLKKHLETQTPYTVDVVMPYTKPTEAKQTAELLMARAGTPMRLIALLDDAALGFIQIANQVFQACANPYFVYLAQDAFPGRFWLRNALHTLQQENKGLLAFNDGKWFGQLAAFGLVRRTWASTVYEGPLFWHGYNSHYADTELTVVAQSENQLCYNPHAVLIEVDYMKDKRATHPADKQLFAERKTLAFNGKVTHPELLNQFS